jgi:hypothetical protein
MSQVAEQSFWDAVEAILDSRAPEGARSGLPYSWASLVEAMHEIEPTRRKETYKREINRAKATGRPPTERVARLISDALRVPRDQLPPGRAARATLEDVSARLESVEARLSYATGVLLRIDDHMRQMMSRESGGEPDVHVLLEVLRHLTEEATEAAETGRASPPPAAEPRRRAGSRAACPGRPGR